MTITELTIMKIEETQKELNAIKIHCNQCNHPLDLVEWSYGYDTIIDCEEFKYSINLEDKKDPKAKCNQKIS